WGGDAMDAEARGTMARGARSTKPCGPDTPMLVSSLRERCRSLARHAERATVTRTPGTPRRARNKSANIARGMPGVSGCTCDHSCALLHHSCTRDRGCDGARHFLRPQYFRERNVDARLGGKRAARVRAHGRRGLTVEPDARAGDCQ